MAAAGEEPEFTENASDGVNEQTLSSSILNRVKKSGTLFFFCAKHYVLMIEAFFHFLKKKCFPMNLYIKANAKHHHQMHTCTSFRLKLKIY